MTASASAAAGHGDHGRPAPPSGGVHLARADWSRHRLDPGPAQLAQIISFELIWVPPSAGTASFAGLDVRAVFPLLDWPWPNRTVPEPGRPYGGRFRLQRPHSVSVVMGL